MKLKKWKEEDEQRFMALACKEALGTISGDELCELNKLSERRDTSKVPRTAKEIQLDVQRDRDLNEVIEMLQNLGGNSSAALRQPGCNGVAA